MGEETCGNCEHPWFAHTAMWGCTVDSFTEGMCWCHLPPPDAMKLTLAPVQADGGATNSEPGGGAALNQTDSPPNVSEVG